MAPKRKDPTEKELVREGLLNPLPPERFKSLAKRIFRSVKPGMTPEEEEKLLADTLEARAQAQSAFKKGLS